MKIEFFSCKTFAIIFFVWLAYVTKRNPGTLLILLPNPLNSWAFDLLYRDLTKSNDPDYWAIEPTLHWTQPKLINKKVEVLHPDGHIMVIRNFMEPPEVDYALQYLKEKNGDRPIKTSLFPEDWENHFSPSCGFAHGREDQNFLRPFNDFVDLLQEPTNYYGGFETVTDDEDVSHLLGFDIKTFHTKDFVKNQMFLSNLNKTMMTASMHCAPSDSLSIVLAGHKTWIFQSPDQLDKTDYINFKAFLPIGSTDDELLEKMGEHRVVEVGPGDALYFGPDWCHAVVTHPGKSLMYTLRYALTWDTMRTMTTMQQFQAVSVFATGRYGSHPNDQKKVWGDLYDKVFNMFTCGSSNRVDELVQYFADRFNDGRFRSHGF